MSFLWIQNLINCYPGCLNTTLIISLSPCLLQTSSVFVLRQTMGLMAVWTTFSRTLPTSRLTRHSFPMKPPVRTVTLSLLMIWSVTVHLKPGRRYVLMRCCVWVVFSLCPYICRLHEIQLTNDPPMFYLSTPLHCFVFCFWVFSYQHFFRMNHKSKSDPLTLHVQIYQIKIFLYCIKNVGYPTHEWQNVFSF